MLIALNPGHFPGMDPGAVSADGVEEATVVRAVGRILQVMLALKGIYCRWVEANELSDIVDQVNGGRAELFISLHANAAVNTEAAGCETYCFPGSEAGQALASAIQNSLVQQLKLTDRGVKEARFYVLRYTDIPAVLCELAFLSNPQEASLLADQKWQSQAAGALAAGISAYCEEHN